MSCVTKLLKQYEFLTEKEANNLVSELRELKKQHAQAHQSREYLVKEGMENFSKSVRKAVDSEINNTLVKYKALKHVFQEGFAGDYGEGLYSLFVGTTRNVQGTPDVANLASSEFVRTRDWFLNEVYKNGKKALFDDPESSLAIFKEVRSRGREGYKPHADPLIVEAGDLVTKLNNRMLSRRQNKGSTIEQNVDYVFKQIWDSDKIASNKKQFVESMLPRIKPITSKKAPTPPTIKSGESAEAFKVREKEYAAALKKYDSGKISDTRVFLEEMAENAEAIDFNRTGMSFGRRVIEFVDDDAAWNTNQEWGYGDMLSGLAEGIKAHSKKYALESVFGNDPVKTVNDIRETILKVAPKKSNLAPLSGVGNAKLDDASKALNFFLGSGSMKGRGVVQGGFEAVHKAKVLTSLSKLGSSTFAAANDLSATVISLNTYYGTNPFESTLTAVKNWITSIPPSVQKEVAESLTVSMPSFLTEPFDLITNRIEPGLNSKAVAGLMTLNGTTSLTRMNRASVAASASYFLRRNLISGKNLDRLKLAGFDDLDIKNLSKMAKEFGDTDLQPGHIEDLPADYFESMGGNPVKYQQSLADKLSVHYNEVTNSGSPVPGAREQVAMQRFRPQDDPIRLASELMFQFRGTLMKSGSVFARMLRANDPKGRLLSRDNMGAMATYTLYSALVAYTIDTLKNYVNKNVWPEEVGVGDIRKSLVNSGAAGIWGDFLGGEYYSYGKGVADTLTGPIVGTMSDLGRGIYNADSGEKAMENLYNWGKRQIPGQNLWMIQAFKARFIEESSYKTVKKKKSNGAGRRR